MGLYKNSSGVLSPVAGTPTNTINALENEAIRNGTVNILRNTLSTKTLQSVIITVATDGTITTSGTSTALIAEPIGKISGISGKYHISGCPSGGSASTYCLQLREGTTTYINAYDTGSGVDYTFDSAKTYYVMLVIRASQNMSGKTFKPMVAPLWYDEDYSTGAMTNRELSEVKTGTATRDDTYASSGSVNYVQIGRVVTVNFQDIVVTPSANVGTVLFNGLPKASSLYSWNKFRGCGWTTDRTVTLVEVSKDGYLYFGGTLPSTAVSVYGSIVYITD